MPLLTTYECRIPRDLIRPICEFVGIQRPPYNDDSRKTLVALALTCSSFNHEAERLLYRSMTSTSLWVQSSFIQRISANTNRARYVQVYHHLDLRIWVEDRSHRTNHMLVEYLENLPVALANMVNLKELHYDIYAPNEQSWSNNAKWRGIPDHIISPIQLLSKSMPSFTFKLDNFIYLPQSSNLTVVVPFLTSQSSIQRLSIDNLSIKNSNFPSRSLGLISKLIYLRCTTSHLKEILPTDGIEMLHLGIFPSDYDTLTILLADSQVRTSLKNLKYLSFSPIGRPDLPFQVQLAPTRVGSVFWLLRNIRSVPNIKCLQVMQIPDDKDIEILMNMRSLKMIIIPLQWFSTFEILSDPQTRETRVNPTKSMTRLARHIFQMCPQIRYMGYFGGRIPSQVFTVYKIWDAQAGPGEQPVTYSIFDSDIASRHIFEFLPHVA